MPSPSEREAVLAHDHRLPGERGDVDEARAVAVDDEVVAPVGGGR